MTAAASKYTPTCPASSRNDGGNMPGQQRRDDAVAVRDRHAEPDQREHVEAAVRRPTATPRTKNGQPPQSTTGVASASSIHGRAAARHQRVHASRPGSTSRHRDRARAAPSAPTPTQNRRVMSTQLRVLGLLGGDRPRLERHAADRAASPARRGRSPGASGTSIPPAAAGGRGESACAAPACGGGRPRGRPSLILDRANVALRLLLEARQAALAAEDVGLPLVASSAAARPPVRSCRRPDPFRASARRPVVPCGGAACARRVPACLLFSFPPHRGYAQARFALHLPGVTAAVTVASARRRAR